MTVLYEVFQVIQSCIHMITNILLRSVKPTNSEEVMRTPKPIGAEATENLKKLLEETGTKADFRRVLCIWLRARLQMPSREVAEAIGHSYGPVILSCFQTIKYNSPLGPLSFKK